MRIMTTYNRSGRRALGLLVGPALLAVLGCSGADDIGKLYPVSGTVKYKSEPVAKARINFVPTSKEGRGASGQVENGSFTLTTLNPNDGALEGEYLVTVDDRETDTDSLKKDAEKLAAKKGVEKFAGGMMIPQDMQAKALQAAKGRLPGKYQIASTTDVKVTVKPQSNTLEIELKD
jgi:hypothetical protein